MPTFKKMLKVYNSGFPIVKQIGDLVFNYTIYLGSGTNVRLNVGDNLKLSPILEFIRALYL